MKNLYYFIHLTGRDEGNTGIQRVVRNLGRALQELKLPDLTIVPVRWSEEARSIVHVEPEFVDVISRFGGPEFPPSGLAGSPIPQAQSDADWLLIPEVPHLNSHDPRYPSVQVGPVIACGKSLGLKVAAVFHDILPLVGDAVIGEGELNQYRFMVYAQSLTNLDFIIPNSRASQASLNDWLMAQGVSATRLSRSLEIRLPEEMRGVPRRVPELGQPLPRPKTFNFISLGTVCNRKNQLAAIEAFDRVRRKFPKYEMRFDLVGHVHPEVTAGVRQALSLTEGRLTVSGYLSDDSVREMMANAHASVFVSLAEGFGLPVAESLWLGVPCLCSGTGAVGEIAAGGGCLAVDPTDVDAISASFEKLMFDQKLYQELLGEIAARPLRSWTDYAEDIAGALWASEPTTALCSSSTGESIKIDAQVLSCHEAYSRNGFQSLRNGNSILFIKAAHGRVKEPHLFHGPYILVKAGNYNVYVDGDLSGSITLQFLRSGGELFSESTLHDFGSPIVLSLDADVRDFEVRAVRNWDTERLWLRTVVPKRTA